MTTKQDPPKQPRLTPMMKHKSNGRRARNTEANGISILGDFNHDASLPRFAEPIPNVTVTIGRDAVLACVVDNLRGFKVAWVRVDTQTILSIHHNIITQNPRISLSYNDHRSWYLHIKNVQESDRGWYMCQVNTDPMRSRQGYLQVVVNVVDGEVLFITKVSRLHMANYLCIASNGVPPSISKRVQLKVQYDRRFPETATKALKMTTTPDGCLSRKQMKAWCRISIKDLSIRRVCAKLVPKNLLGEQKGSHFSINQQLLDRLTSESNFKHRIVTSDESCDSDTILKQSYKVRGGTYRV
ncbi:hypothetical protein Trydic_g23682 [Trypoxylus dichotomus]